MDFGLYSKSFRDRAASLMLKEDYIDDLLNYAYNLYRNRLPIIYSPEHFSLLCGYDLAFLYTMSNSSCSFYKQYEIPKKSGGTRPINEPFPSLKEVQTWIKNEILDKASINNVSVVVKSYTKGKNVRDNARFHRGQKLVINLDIVDFFGNIRYGHIYPIFSKLGYSKPLSVLLANLCLYDGRLPQGSPSSPMLSNLVLNEADRIIFEYCLRNNIRYTRYADDLTFSGNNVRVRELMLIVSRTLKQAGFKLNLNKTKVLSRATRQLVTGIVVNDKLQVSRNYRDNIRQVVYFIMKYGLADHLLHIQYTDPPEKYLQMLLGKMNFALLVNENDEDIKVYYRFLYAQLQQVLASKE